MEPRPGTASDLPWRQPLVLLSGMLGDATLWDDVAPLLCDVALPWPSRIDLDDSVTAMAASVLADAPPRFALAGHSLGGIVALEIACQAPQRVRRLALIASSSHPPTPAQQRTWAQWRRRTDSGEFADVAAELAAATLSPGRRKDRQLVATNRRMAHTVGPDGFARQLAAQSTRTDYRTVLNSLDLPVLVVSGEADDVCPTDLQREIADTCPNATWTVIALAGHMVPLEAADALASALRTWLSVRCQ